jgi:hypothetical protein
MKQCPKCRSTYTDDGLRFCLTDGTRLTDVPDENETQVAGRGATVRVDALEGNTVDAKSPRSAASKVILIGGLAGLLLIVVIGLIGVLAYYGLRNTTKTTENKVDNKNVASNPIAVPTPDSEKQRLQDELANIQKRLSQDEKNSNRPVSQPTPNAPDVVSARVNSPNDGFLALRSRPDVAGELVVKIPHGDTVTIENCNRRKVIIGGRAGRWCLISWGGYQGYVFDAWLIY